eukprot:TRINITY_DN15051_c0_g1_i1.p1 TRINITY_DN15051_c0_g1~~TRINITY_DN15051_c0_g1_i1.p1  ORF type:complete len:142 (+),score=26.46 TRINITY_DN15051_c0_g1_i1:27-428(+)
MLKVVAFVCLVFALICAYAPIQTEAQSNIECTICTFVISEIEFYVLRNASLREIAVYVNATCNSDFLKAYERVCERILNYGVVELVDYIKHNQTPTQICGPSELHLCSSAEEAQAQTSVVKSGPAFQPTPIEN